LDAVDDVVQETALAAWQSYGSRQRAGVHTWLGGILRHKTADFYRRDPGWQWTRLHDETPDAPHGEASLLLRLMMQRLPGDYGRVLWLRFWGGLSLPEVGTALGISADAARGRYKRALTALRQEWLA